LSLLIPLLSRKWPCLVVWIHLSSHVTSKFQLWFIFLFGWLHLNYVNPDNSLQLLHCTMKNLLIFFWHFFLLQSGIVLLILFFYWVNAFHFWFCILMNGYLLTCSVWSRRTEQTRTSIICLNFMMSWPMHTMIRLWCQRSILRDLIVPDLHFWLVHSYLVVLPWMSIVFFVNCWSS